MRNSPERVGRTSLLAQHPRATHLGRIGASVLGTLLLVGYAGCDTTQYAQPPTLAYLEARPQTYPLEGDIRHVHDPAIIKDGDTYYLFSTGAGIPIRCSHDLRRWTLCGQVFSQLPEWAKRDFPRVDKLWAPDISHFGEKYHLYYAVSTFGSNGSTIGLVTNRTLDPASDHYNWLDEGKVIESRKSNDYNAIDPNIVVDEEGGLWLVFGSFWSGIKARQIDPRTGKPSARDTGLYPLAERRRGPASPGAIEAPFILRKGEYYYLFVSFDFCCRGIRSTYRVVVGRSRRVTGPYLDRDRLPMLAGGGTPVLSASTRWRGPGHNSILLEETGDKIFYHAYDAEAEGIPTLRIGSVVWDRDGWPHATNED